MTPLEKEDSWLDEILDTAIIEGQEAANHSSAVNNAKQQILSKLTAARIDELELLVKDHNTKSKQRITNCSVVNNLVKRRLSKLQAQLPKKEES